MGRYISNSYNTSWDTIYIDDTGTYSDDTGTLVCLTTVFNWFLFEIPKIIAHNTTFDIYIEIELSIENTIDYGFLEYLSKHFQLSVGN